jgi:hypothetical protein
MQGMSRRDMCCETNGKLMLVIKSDEGWLLPQKT